MMIGTADGTLLLQPIDIDKLSVTRLTAHQYEAPNTHPIAIDIHGNNAIVDISMSHDSNNLFSSDASGCYFMVDLTQKQAQPSSNNHPLYLT